MNFLNLEGKRFLVFGVANRRSVAWQTASLLEENGAEVVFSVRSEQRRESLSRLLGERRVEVCDVETEGAVDALAARLADAAPFDGLLHSIAFANYSEGVKPFHQTKRADFLQATTISAFSLVEMARAFKPHLKPDASVVAISISSQVTAENYGYMSPVKAALESAVRFLAKSFSADSQVRFNTVNSGPLKTSASAGIPGYLDNYLFAEKLTFRKRAVSTKEVASVAAFLLSPASSGINGQGLVVNAGMDINYFDREVVDAAAKADLSRLRNEERE